jgi:hypothetical protein
MYFPREKHNPRWSRWGNPLVFAVPAAGGLKDFSCLFVPEREKFAQ